MRSLHIENVFSEKNIRGEVLNLKKLGLRQIFTIHERISWWSKGGIILLSTVQILGGLMLLPFPIINTVGTGLIAEGVYDLFHLVRDNFTWRRYGVEKVLNVTLRLLLGHMFNPFYIWVATPIAAVGKSILERAVRSQAGKSLEILLNKLADSNVKSIIWRPVANFLLQSLYREQISKEAESNGLTEQLRAKYQEKFEKEEEKMKNKLKELMENVTAADVLDTDLDELDRFRLDRIRSF